MVKDSLTDRLNYMVSMKTKGKGKLTNDELRQIYVDSSALILDEEVRSMLNIMNKHIQSKIKN